MSPRGTDRVLWCVVALVALRVLAVAIVLWTGPDSPDNVLGGDARRYDQIATAEGLPYRDTAVEYPPLSVVLIEVVSADTLRGTLLRLAVSQLVLDLATAAVLGWGFRRRVAVAYLVLGTPFVLYPFLYFRLDLLSVALAAAGLAALARNRDGLGGAALATGVLAKLWPFALAPIVLVERRGRALFVGALTGIALTAVWLIVAGADGVIQVVSFRGSQGWQIESTTGALAHLAQPDRVHVEGGAWRTGVMAPGVRLALTALSLGWVAISWWWAGARRREGAPSWVVFGLAPLSATLGLLVFAPILSPQYVLWLLPAAAVTAAAGDRRSALGVLAAAGLSTLALATIKAQVAGETWAVGIVVLRNLVLVALLAHVATLLAGTQPLPGRSTRGAPTTAGSATSEIDAHDATRSPGRT